jgi:hypothetical protein
MALTLTGFFSLLCYIIYLNIKIKELQDDILNNAIDIGEVSIRVGNEIIDIQKKQSKTNNKQFEKSRRRSTKRCYKVPAV